MMLVVLAATCRAAPPEIRTVPEMQRIEALEVAANDRATRPEVPEAFRERWAKLAPAVNARLTPELARALSHWARPQMERYTHVPRAERAAWRVARARAGGGLTLWAKLDTLPSHAAMVTRWLELVASWDPHAQAILAVWITIRGEVLE